MNKNLYEKLPDTPGVYLMKGVRGRLLYIGKAANLQRRVASYFLRPHDLRIQKLVSEIVKIDYRETDSALEALILESDLIKKYQPPYNIREKDDKSFLYVQITKERFPRVLLVRGKAVNRQMSKVGCFHGPFVSASGIKEALKIIRKIFPYSIHPADKIGKFKRPCFDYDINICPGVCVNLISRKEYEVTIKNIRLIFAGQKKRLLSSLAKEMRIASNGLDFEKAEKIKRQIFALNHIRDTALISDGQLSNVNGQLFRRIEGYDISNISGALAVGAMVVFTNGEQDRKEYRKFRIRNVIGSNDVGMMEEILRRRFENKWRHPDLILIDGGIAQVNIAEAVLREFNLNIPVVGLVKGPERKRNDLVGKLPAGVDLKTLIKVRDEAHRFAISYHKRLRARNFLE